MSEKLAHFSYQLGLHCPTILPDLTEGIESVLRWLGGEHGQRIEVADDCLNVFATE